MTRPVEMLREAAGCLRRALLDVSPDSADRGRLLVELATVERGFDPAAAVRHVFYAAPLLPTARERAEAVARLAPATLVHELGRDLVAEVSAELAGTDRDLALRLEARSRYATLDDPAALDLAADRLAGLGMGTGGERELLTVLAYAATVGAKAPADEIARLMVGVLDREPAAPDRVHTALPLAMLALVAVDRSALLLPWLDTAQGAERALALVFLGRVGEAKEAALAATAHPVAMTALSMAALELRDPELTNRVLALPHGKHPCFDVHAQLLRASATALAGDFRQALDEVLTCGRKLDRAGWVNPVLFRWQTTAALLHHQLGDRDAALGLATDARTRALAWGAASGIGGASRVVGHLTPGRPGVELLREAVAVLESSDNVLEQAKARLALGTRLRSAGDPTASEVLRAARELAGAAGMPWLAAQSGGLLSATDTVEPGRPLTRSEARVVELAAGDRTNHEIAEFLGISCRAVEKHLTNSFRKLGIRRRTELAGALAAGSA